VAAELAKQGAVILDADQIGQALLDQRPARELVWQRFGQEVILPPCDTEPEPRINRKALGAIVFQDRHARGDLEAILHPRMRRTFEKAIGRIERKREAKAIVLDAAVLLEAGWNNLCDKVLFVDTPPEQRLARVQSQRGWTESDLLTREQAQLALDQKRLEADSVVNNTGSEAELAGACAKLIATLFPRPPRVRRSRTTGARIPTP
jgi:dephospho-CoA kinase